MCIMGCTTSVPDPNIMYGNRHKQPGKANVNGSIHGKVSYGNKENNNGDKPPAAAHCQSNGDNNDTSSLIKGDLLKRNEAKVLRERKARSRSRVLELMAKEVSEKAMEDTERLSLVSSRSRATSRNSSAHRLIRRNNVNASSSNGIHPSSSAGLLDGIGNGPVSLPSIKVDSDIGENIEEHDSAHGRPLEARGMDVTNDVKEVSNHPDDTNEDKDVAAS